MYYTYFLESIKNESIYIGSTDKDPIDRLQEHNRGTNIWTKHNGPFKLIYFEKYNCRADARSRELFYKTGFGKNIKYLIVNYLKEKKIEIEYGV